MRDIIAKTYFGLGDRERAETEWRRTVEIRQGIAPKAIGRLRSRITNLGSAVENEGQAGRSGFPAQGSLGAVSADRCPRDPQRGTVLDNLAQVRQKLGDLPGAEKWQREALAFREQIKPRDWDGLTSSYNNLAIVHGPVAGGIGNRIRCCWLAIGASRAPTDQNIPPSRWHWETMRRS